MDSMRNPTGSGTCVACNNSCSSCFGSSSKQCYQCAAGYIFNGVECIKCDPSCSFCYGTANTQCTICKAGYWLFNNNTCVSVCDPPLIQTSNGNQSFCQSPCNSTTFVLWDQTCSPSCDSPLKPIQPLTSISLCQYPCSASEYLYWNGTCSNICSTPFIQQTYHSRSFCTYPCTQNQYAYWNSSCFSTCNSPLIQTMQGNYNFCIYPCASTEFLYWNGTCSSSCLSPLAQRVENGSQYCDFPCSSSEYLYWNSTCISSCVAPLVQQSEGSPSKMFCRYPCGNDEYLYQNSSCLSSCAFPFVSQTESTKRFCRAPCANKSYAVYMNGSCTSVCTTPFSGYVYGSVTICKPICNGGEYLYPNGSCSSICGSPYIQRSDSNSKYCDNPCSVKEYYIANGSCLSSCDSPMLVRMESYGNRCFSPCTNTLDYYYKETQECLTTCNSQSVNHQGLYLECLPEYQNSEDATTETTLTTLQTIAKSIKFPSLALIRNLQYIRYLNMDLPTRLERLTSYRPRNIMSLDFMPGMSMVMQAPFKKQQLPIVFEKHRLHSRFLVNFWNTMSSMIIIIAVGGLFFSLERIAIRRNWINFQAVCQRFKLVVLWNFCVIFLLTNIDNIILYSALELETAKLDNILTATSLLICLSFIILIICLLIRSHRFLKKFRDKRTVSSNIKMEGKSPPKSHNYQAINQGFNERGRFNPYFYFIYIARVSIPMFFTVWLPKSPIAQAIINLLITFIITSYLIYRVPLQNKLNQFQLVIVEIMTLMINISVFGLTVGDSNGNNNQKLSIFFGDVVIIGNMLINFFIIVMIVIKIIVESTSIYLMQKPKQHKEKIAYFYLIVPVLQQGLFGFEEILDENYRIDYIRAYHKAKDENINKITNCLTTNSVMLHSDAPIFSDGPDDKAPVIGRDSNLSEMDMTKKLVFHKRNISVDIENKSALIDDRSLNPPNKEPDGVQDLGASRSAFTPSHSRKVKEAAKLRRPSTVDPTTLIFEDKQPQEDPVQIPNTNQADNKEEHEGSVFTDSPVGLQQGEFSRNLLFEGMPPPSLKPRPPIKKPDKTLLQQVYGSIRTRYHQAGDSLQNHDKEKSKGSQDSQETQENQETQEIFKKSLATIFHLNPNESRKSIDGSTFKRNSIHNSAV